MDCYISGTDSKVLPGCSKTANDKVISTQSIPEPMGPSPINTVIMLVTRWCTLQINKYLVTYYLVTFKNIQPEYIIKP